MAKADKTDDGSVRRHLLVGWVGLLAFLALGMLLETMHGLKIGWYLDVANETRRLTWRLAHAHGALLSLVNLGFAFTIAQLGLAKESWVKLASRCLIGATILLPGGFLLGGLWIHGGDPGPGILAAPVGAVLFFVAVVLTARGVLRSARG